ncbi:2OG-Fe(II) oxygenase superfamily [Delftia tsuruhatensis]|uniref:2OG-Fe(II) oxygenase n=1 Tax=Delftia tsuruhatensis TaxID=180282 RepID=UPI001E79B321|nr:2OG-Fe(II) oxygenase [Delftia tsuruhatensis]CAB5696993.1 2OG-Fe(II) oxygenase superfamily [Delftia tsuruhatensis]CAC9678611.1 2OG-Fe(II) oxygenase superfamily [Delftia tsuruhatensis]
MSLNPSSPDSQTTAQDLPPGLTPELMQWVQEQSASGVSPAALLRSMRDVGWSEALARKALGLPGEIEAAPAAAIVSASSLPEPDLAQDPCTIDVGDRQVQVLVSMRNPRIVVFGNLLSDEECEAIIAAARPRMARSLTVATQSGGEEINEDRTSNGMFFQRGETGIVSRLEERIARLVRWPLDHGEGLQVLHYGPGAEYKPHHDYFAPHEPGTPTILKRGGQRVGTLVIYLNEPERGGATVFPEVPLQVVPRRGNAVFFSYERPDPSTRTLHGGAPVLAGEKWIATKWLREREFH